MFGSLNFPFSIINVYCPHFTHILWPSQELGWYVCHCVFEIDCHIAIYIK
jgi:hypothetical protein